MKDDRTLSYFLVFVILPVVFLLNMAFSSAISKPVLLLTRILLVALFGGCIILFRITQQENARRLAFTLMVINLAFFLVSFFTTGFWGLDLQTPKGIAFAKLSDSVVISAVLIVMFLAGGYRWKDIYLAKGRLFIGLLIGISTFLLMGFLAMGNPEQPVPEGFIRQNLTWILVFVFSNAFMEELLFRGILLKNLNRIMKPGWTILITSIIFAAAHLQVNYTQDVMFFAGITFVLGILWATLMHYTRSMIASVLFHAGADLLIILPIYASFGAQ